jgi:cytochrome c oxidase subunit 2
MPIAVEVVPPAQFAQWVAAKGGTIKGAKTPDSTAGSPATEGTPAAGPVPADAAVPGTTAKPATNSQPAVAQN